MEQLIKYKHLLTAGQKKKQILDSLQTGGYPASSGFSRPDATGEKPLRATVWLFDQVAV